MKTALLLAALVASGCAAARTDTVLAVARTKVFHTAACTKVAMARTVAMTIAEARSLAYKPCPGCRPGGGSL